MARRNSTNLTAALGKALRRGKQAAKPRKSKMSPIEKLIANHRRQIANLRAHREKRRKEHAAELKAVDDKIADHNTILGKLLS